MSAAAMALPGVSFRAPVLAWAAIEDDDLRFKRIATTVLAASAGNDFLQTAFTLLCERANAARSEGEDTQRPFSPARRAA